MFPTRKETMLFHFYLLTFYLQQKYSVLEAYPAEVQFKFIFTKCDSV